jgi:predicted RND superfamily exporter protein
MKEKFGGSTTLQILVQGNINDPVVLERMKKMESFLSSRPELNNVHSVVELIEEMNFAMIDEKILPDTEAKVANLWFFLEGEEMLDQLVSEERNEAVIQATIKEYNIRQLTELVHTIRSYIRGMDSEECSFQLGGSLLTYYQVNEALKKSQIQSLVIAILMIFICNFIMLRSVAGSLVGLIPVGFTLFILYGFMGLSGIPLDVATVLIGSISLGVGIDYSIHFLNRFKHDYRVSQDKTTALAATLRTTGKAILINVVTVTAGFLTLLLGNLIPLQRFGILISLTMLSSGSGALLLLPSVILLCPEKLFRGVMGRISLSGTGTNIKTRLQPVRVKRDPGNIRKPKTKGVNK